MNGDAISTLALIGHWMLIERAFDGQESARTDGMGGYLSSICCRGGLQETGLRRALYGD